MSVDFSELDAYASKLEFFVEGVSPDLSRDTENSAHNIKVGAQQRLRAWSRGVYLKHYPKSLSYDMDEDGLGAEIGPDPSKPQGGMGTGVEFGSKNTPPSPHLHPAFEEELPRWREQILRTMVRDLK